MWQGASAYDDFGYSFGGAGAGGGYYGGGTCPDCAGSGGSGLVRYPVLNGETNTYSNKGNGYAIITYSEYISTNLFYHIKLFSSIFFTIFIKWFFQNGIHVTFKYTLSPN